MEVSIISAGAGPFSDANAVAAGRSIVSGLFSCSGAFLSPSPSRPRPSHCCPVSTSDENSTLSSSSSSSSSSSFSALSRSSSCNRRSNEFQGRTHCTESLMALCYSPHAIDLCRKNVSSSSMLRSISTLSRPTFRVSQFDWGNSVARSARRSSSSTISCSASSSVPSEEIAESSLEDSQDQQQLRNQNAGIASSSSRDVQEGESMKEEGEGAQNSQTKKPGAFKSSWDAKDSEGKDYLYRLGKESDNLNVTVGARKGMVDDVFVGNFLGKESDIVFEYRQKVTRSLQNLQGDYYIAPAFMETVVTHITKNYLAPYLDIEVPLILGIWGGKGQGKSFQLELICKALGMEPIIMSAGELESEWAGEPGRLIRQRYRTAAQVIKVQGKMSALVINDLDAGVGRFDNTQCTVNNQMVVGSLMNLADNPTRVSIGQEWREADIVSRVPIIITGNDLSTIYAPLIRDGRMDKFYWQPTREDIVNIVHYMYRKDGLSMEDISTVVDTFPNQALDFYGALRSRLYDQEILKWIEKVGGIEKLGSALVSRKRSEESVPAFVTPEPSLKKLLQAGESLVREQQLVKKMRLSEEYMKTMKAFKGGGGLSMLAS